MTREEAIKMLKSKMNGHTDTSYEWTETVRMAIKALEQEPCDGCKYFDGNSCKHYDYKVGYTQGYEDASKPFRQEPCDDVVSRDAALMCLTGEFVPDKEYKPEELISMFSKRIRNLPSVRPQEQTGHWILLDECANSGYYCSECQKKLVKEGWSKTVKKIKFCPNCGAKMVEPQESKEGGEQW